MKVFKEFNEEERKYSEMKVKWVVKEKEKKYLSRV